MTPNTSTGDAMPVPELKEYQVARFKGLLRACEEGDPRAVFLTRQAIMESVLTAPPEGLVLYGQLLLGIAQSRPQTIDTGSGLYAYNPEKTR